MRARQEAGLAMLFFLGALLPAMLLIASIGVDVSTYLRECRGLQVTADRAALHGSHFLPDSQASRRAIIRYVSNIKALEVASLAVEQGEIRLQLRKSYAPFLARYFAKQGSTPWSFPVRAGARATTAPLDVFVAVDRGAHLAPFLDAPDGAGWGERSHWPEASLFSETFPFHSALSRRIVTQQCYNPIFSRLKESALIVLEMLGAQSQNRVGVSFFPGVAGTVSRTRPMEAGDLATEEVSFFDVRLGSDDGVLIGIEEIEAAPFFPVSSIHCAAIAEREENTEHYQFADAPDWIPESLHFGQLIDTESWSVNDQYQVSSREKIWSRVVNPMGEASFEHIAQAAKFSFLNEQPLDRHPTRFRVVKRVLVVVSDGLPRIHGSVLGHDNDDQREAFYAELKALEHSLKRGGGGLAMVFLLHTQERSNVARLQEILSEYQRAEESHADFIVTQLDAQSPLGDQIDPLLMQLRRANVVR